MADVDSVVHSSGLYSLQFINVEKNLPYVFKVLTALHA